MKSGDSQNFRFNLLFNPALLIYYEVELGDRRAKSLGESETTISGLFLKIFKCFYCLSKG